MNLGDTFTALNHVWIVCSLPAADGSIVAVNFTTWHPKCPDENCIVEAGEHPFVKHKTYVAYERAKAFPKAAQEQIEKLCPLGPAVSAIVLERIQLGALKSDLMAVKLQIMIKNSHARQAKKTP